MCLDLADSGFVTGLLMFPKIKILLVCVVRLDFLVDAWMFWSACGFKELHRLHIILAGIQDKTLVNQK